MPMSIFQLPNPVICVPYHLDPVRTTKHLAVLQARGARASVPQTPVLDVRTHLQATAKVTHRQTKLCKPIEPKPSSVLRCLLQRLAFVPAPLFTMKSQELLL